MSDVSALNLEPDEVVGGYTLVSRLGAGAMGSVWRVTDGGGQTYAMKILRDSLTDGSSSDAAGVYGSNATAESTALPDRQSNLKTNATPRERLRREALALKRVHHPGVCAIVDMELDDALAFIVTELIEGRNLRDDVAVNGRYTGDDLERLSRKLIDAVKAVHAAGIVHRDIKPTNVMVSVSGPVLVDFGIAMTGGESHVTRTGLVMGTPGFIAPEIIDGAESDDITDWWSVASVLAFAATGKPVFGTSPMMAVLERAAAGTANLTGLPANTRAAFRSALNPNRAQRCTPDQLLHAIAMDAMASHGWQLPVNGTGTASADNTELMPPFDGHGSTPPIPSQHASGNAADLPITAMDNPRLAWRDHDVAEQSATDTWAPPEMTHHSTAVLPVSTTVMPVGQAPKTLDTLPAITAEFPSRPALQHVTDSSDVSAQAAAAFNPPYPQQAPSYPQPATAQPTDAPMQEAPAAPAAMQVPAANPADIRRGLYCSHGTLPLILFTAPLAILAANMPLIAFAAAAAMLWLMLVLGYNTESQLKREGRRGGMHKDSDTWLRAVSLPWHMVKALLSTLPRLLLAATIGAVGTAAVTMLLDLPTSKCTIRILSHTASIPLPIDTPRSSTGACLAGLAAIVWLITVFGPNSMILRLGAGALRGRRTDPQPSADDIPAATSDGKGRYSPALLAIWGVACMALTLLTLVTPLITWMPLS